MILALVFCCDTAEILADVEKWNLLQEHKYRMKRIFTASPAPAQCLEVFPRDVACAPSALLAQAFPQGFKPFELDRGVFDFVLQQGASFPLRKTNRAAPSSSRLPVRSGSVPDLCQAFAGVLSHSLTFQNLGRERETEKELPGFKLLDQKEKASQNAPLALEDAKSDLQVSLLRSQRKKRSSLKL